MDGLKKALGNAPVFVIAYIVFMLPTYFLPFLGSNSLAVNAAVSAKSGQVNPLLWFHLGALLVLCFLCWIRGAYVQRAWLVLFPFLAIAFDFVPGLSSIPLIPTLMHLLALILGVVGARATATQGAVL